MTCSTTTQATIIYCTHVFEKMEGRDILSTYSNNTQEEQTEKGLIPEIKKSIWHAMKTYSFSEGGELLRLHPTEDVETIDKGEEQ